MSVKVFLATPQGTFEYELRKGLGLQAMCAKSRAPIDFDCRRADCGVCVVKVKEGMNHINPPNPQERDFLKAMGADADERLACQCRIFGTVSLEVEF